MTLSNLGTTDSDAVVTIHPDGGVDPDPRTLSVPHGTVRTFSRASLAIVARDRRRDRRSVDAVAARPDRGRAVLPDVVVSAGLETDDALAVVPCATKPSTDWQFAAGTTVRGVTQWLVLQDPFSADARVDVSLRTDSGLQLLPSLQGIDVPARSRVVIPIHDRAVRQERVAVEVHAIVGQVVAAQTIDFGADPGRAASRRRSARSRPRAAGGSATGGPSPMRSNRCDHRPRSGRRDVVVQAGIGSKGIVQPVVLQPSRRERRAGCSSVDVPATRNRLAVPDGGGYDLTVQSDAQVPIVAQTLSRFDDANRRGSRRDLVDGIHQARAELDHPAHPGVRPGVDLDRRW